MKYMIQALVLLIAHPASAVVRDDYRALAFQVVTHTPGTQVCTYLSAQPLGTGGAEWIDEGCHGAGSAPGGFAKVDDGFYPSGAPEGDRFTSQRHEMSAWDHRYGFSCDLLINPLSAPVAWEDAPADRLVEYYLGRCFGSVSWVATGATYTPMLLDPWAVELVLDDARVRLTTTCDGVVTTYDSDIDPLEGWKPITPPVGADCSLYTEVNTTHYANDVSGYESMHARVVIAKVEPPPPPPSGGCGLGMELLAALPAWWAARRRR